jgi:hypothetical protein
VPGAFGTLVPGALGRHRRTLRAPQSIHLEVPHMSATAITALLILGAVNMLLMAIWTISEIVAR